MSTIYINSKSEYTMFEFSQDGTQHKTVKPPKYSPVDKYAKYRRQYYEKNKN